MKTKKLSVFFLIGLFLLMLFSPETVATGAANGLLLWYRKVLPVLFPFLLITGLMNPHREHFPDQPYPFSDSEAFSWHF